MNTLSGNDIYESPNQSITMTRDGELQKVCISRGNTQVSFTLGNGGHIDSCCINGVEIFCEFFGVPEKPKGGMPFMFPNAGPLTDEQKQDSGYNLPQHGFGRLSHWDFDGNTGEQILIFSENKDFPFSGEVRNTIEIGEEGSVQFTQKITNTGVIQMPISSGLHPYFRVPNRYKDAINWDFEGAERVFQQRETWKNSGTGKYTVPQNGRLRFTIPDIGNIQLGMSADYKKFWVWSLPDMNFICVEPVMGDVGAITEDPLWIEPGVIHRSFLKISLKK